MKIGKIQDHAETRYGGRGFVGQEQARKPLIHIAIFAYPQDSFFINNPGKKSDEKHLWRTAMGINLSTNVDNNWPSMLTNLSYLKNE